MGETPTIQDVENFWNNRPCNLRHSNKELGTKEYFNEVEERKYFVEPHIPKFAEFNKWRGKKVLEIGCGIGTDAVNFARAGADYTGIELSGKSLEIAEERFKVFGLNGGFKCVNAEELSQHFELGSFDLVYSFGVIHHTPNPCKVLKEIYKVLKDNGELRIMLYAKNSWKAQMIELGFDQPEAQYGCPIANMYTKEDVYNLLIPKINNELTNDYVFKNIEIDQDHIFPYKIAQYKQYLYEYEEWFKYMPKQMFENLEKEMGWHLLIKTKK